MGSYVWDKVGGGYGIRVGVILGYVAPNNVYENFRATAKMVVRVSVAPKFKKWKKSLYNKYFFYFFFVFF